MTYQDPNLDRPHLNILSPQAERNRDAVPPYGDGPPMDNSGVGGALAVALVACLALVGVVSLNVRHETGETPLNRPQAAAQQTGPVAPSVQTH